MKSAISPHKFDKEIIAESSSSSTSGFWVETSAETGQPEVTAVGGVLIGVTGIADSATLLIALVRLVVTIANGVENVEEGQFNIR